MQIAIEKFDKEYIELIKNLSDKDIILVYDGKPLARVIPFEEEKSRKHIFGGLKGMAEIKSDITESVGEKWESETSPKLKKTRPLGILKGKAVCRIKDDFGMTDEELLGYEVSA